MACPDGFWCLQLKDVLNFLILGATIFAIVWGPLKAIEISKRDELSKERIRRRYGIFHDLMKTRRIPLSPERVAALNLVHLEFHDCAAVLEAFKKYLAFLTSVPQPVPENYLIEREAAFTELVFEIGVELGLKFDRLELQRLSYFPEGWNLEQAEMQNFRTLVIELLQGKRALPVVQQSIQSSQFPPAPNS
jgi:hypothetical protein